MFEVQEALNSQKEEFTRREDAFRRREEALRRKDLELQESLIKFNKFLQENEVSSSFLIVEYLYTHRNIPPTNMMMNTYRLRRIER